MQAAQKKDSGQLLGRYRILKKLSSDRMVLFSVAYLLIVIACVLFPKQLSPFDPAAQNLFTRLQPPFTEGHILGTDSLGRDVLSRLIKGARYSSLIALFGVLMGTSLGVILGLIAGYYRGKADTIIMRIVDIQLGFTNLLFQMVIVIMIGPGITTLIFVFGFLTWVIYARVVRGAVLYLRESQFVQAARSIGCSDRRILFVHIMPNLIAVLTTICVLELARLMVVEAGITFLGFGVQPPDITWGLLIAEGRNYIQQAWWLVTFSGLSIVLTVLSINLVGSWLRAMTDPFQRRLVGTPR